MFKYGTICIKANKFLLKNCDNTMILYLDCRITWDYLVIKLINNLPE